MNKKFKRIPALLLACAMLFALVPASPVAMAESGTPSGTALDATGGELTSGTYYLAADIELTEAITIADTEEVTLDLNGHTLTLSGGLTASAANNVINNAGTLTLTDSSAGNVDDVIASTTTTGTTANGDGTYTTVFVVSSLDEYDNLVQTYYAYTAGAVVGTILDSGTFTMNGGIVTTLDTSCTQAGIYSTNADTTFTINGGAVANCIHSGGSYGGGVYASGYSAMTGGAVVNCSNVNSSTSEGGGIAIAVDNSSSYSFTMSGGYVTGNASCGGGGIYCGTVLKLSGGYITDNAAADDSKCGGGGVTVYRTSTVTGGNIINNTVTCTSASQTFTCAQGGGLFLNSTSTLKNCIIAYNTSENTAKASQGNGGGVYYGYSLNSVTVGTGTRIVNNTATGNGGGVYTNYRISVSGGEITGNSAAYGGGVYGKSASVTTITTFGSGAIYHNTASTAGDDVALYYYSGTLGLCVRTAAQAANMTSDAKCFTAYQWFTDAEGSRFENYTTSEAFDGTTTQGEYIYLKAVKTEDQGTVHYVTSDGTEVATQEYDPATYDVLDDVVTGCIPDGYLYAGMYNSFKRLSLSEDTSAGLTVVYDGDYFVKVIDDDYVTPRTLTVTYGNDDTKYSWLITAVDDVDDYNSVGFILSCDALSDDVVLSNTTAELTDTITVYMTDGTTYTYTTEQLFGNNSGTMAVYDLGDLSQYESNGETVITVTPYVITKDNVILNGKTTRTITYTDGTLASTGTIGDTSAVTLEDEAQDVTYSEFTGWGDEPENTAIVSVDIANATIAPYSITPPETSVVITKVCDGTAESQTVEAGDLTGTITAADKDGYLFAGWYTDEACTTAADFSDVQESMTVYAKYISDDYLQVAYTTTSSKGVITKVRLISAVDGKYYTNNGFVITVNGQETVVNVSKYNSVVGTSSAKKLFGVTAASKLFYYDLSTKTCSAGDTITVTPYYTTLDGTVVYGTTQTFVYQSSSLEG